MRNVVRQVRPCGDYYTTRVIDAATWRVRKEIYMTLDDATAFVYDIAEQLCGDGGEYEDD